jgi:formylglycine-generating enzyme required for sulfatase activity
MFEEPVPVAEAAPDVPPALAELIGRLLAKARQDRPQSAAEVVAALSALEADQAANPQPAPSARVTVEYQRTGARSTQTHATKTQATTIAMATAARRRRTLVVMIAGVGLLAVALTLVLRNYLARDDDADPQPPAANPNAEAVAPFDAPQAKAYQEAWAGRLGVDVEIKNSVGMRLRLIPPGEFTIGSTKTEISEVLTRTEAWNKENVRSEGPPRRTLIPRAFYMGIHEVTVGQFRAFVKATGYETWGERTGKGGRAWDGKLRRMVLKPGFIWSSRFVADTENHPVVLVHREDVEAFCDWLNKQEDGSYGLPSEQQWEFACRAGTTSRWFWGDDESQAKHYGWFMDPASSARQMPVGLKLANAFGLYDMAGNVAEMTLDAKSEIVMRGGHAGYPPQQTRSAAREIEKHTDPTYRNGFRLVLQPKQRSTT